jgi:hypothetical protein
MAEQRRCRVCGRVLAESNPHQDLCFTHRALEFVLDKKDLVEDEVKGPEFIPLHKVNGVWRKDELCLISG